MKKLTDINTSKLLISIVWAFIFLTGTQGFSLDRPVLSFSKEIEISKKTKIHLADLVIVKNPNHQILNAIKNIVFINWDVSGSLEREFSSYEMGKILNQISEKNREIKELNPIYKIPSSVKMKLVSQGYVSKNEIQNRLDQIFKIKCPDCVFEYTIKNEINVNQPSWSIDYSNVDLKNNILLPLVQGEYKSFRWLTIGVKIQAPSYVASKNLNMGYRISEKDFQTEVREIRDMGDRIKNIDDLIGSKLIRPMRAGEILLDKILRRDPLTKRGAYVKAIMGSDTYELQTQFIAQEEGYKNDIIKIKNPDNGKMLSGTVIDQDVVRIKE